MAALFYSIGIHGIKSQFLKTTAAAGLSKASGKNKKLFEEILLLFVNTEEIEIIGNVMLNSILDKIADLLMQVIVIANNSVCSIFESYD